MNIGQISHFYSIIIGTHKQYVHEAIQTIIEGLRSRVV